MDATKDGATGATDTLAKDGTQATGEVAGDLESGVKTSAEEEDAVTKNIHKIIRREVAEGDARVVYVRKAPKAEEGRCQTLICCLAIMLTLLVLIMVIKVVKGV